EVATGHIERLTQNEEVGEMGPFFSPDSRLVAFIAPDDLTQYSMKNRRAYVRPVGERGGEFRKLGTNFDGDIGGGFWSEDGRTYYFNAGIRATRQLMALDIRSGEVRQVTDERAALSVDYDEDGKRYLIDYQDPKAPPTLFAVDNIYDATRRTRGGHADHANPAIPGMALGAEEELAWRPPHGRRVGGVLDKPLGSRVGQRYPLFVAIHGGPASADVLNFNGAY